MWLHGSGNERGKELIPTRKGCLQKNLTEKDVWINIFRLVKRIRNFNVKND